jgi:signal transduction histidine kinase
VTGSSQHRRSARILAVAALAAGALLFGIFAAMVLGARTTLRAEIRRTIIEREAAILRPFTLQQIAEESATASPPLAALLRSAHREGVLAVDIFDADGRTLAAVPSDQLFVELPIDDYMRLRANDTLSRYHPQFPLDQYFAGVSPDRTRAPVLEVLLALRMPGTGLPLGFVRYFIDARSLARELDGIDSRLGRQTNGTLVFGGAVLALVAAAAGYGLQRFQHAIARSNARLACAHFELTLAAKASALGQITSHLIHGLQGPVAGLRAAVAAQGAADWESAGGYTERMQEMIGETVALLRDIGANASYEIDASELVDAIRERNRAAADQCGVMLSVASPFAGALDSHRGGVLCLIASNLVQNAIAASPRGRTVEAVLKLAGGNVILDVIDQGSGIPDAQRTQLFVPGQSGRAGGSGLGLSISRLLARQIGATLELVATGPAGTTFRLMLPLVPASPSLGQDD